MNAGLRCSTLKQMAQTMTYLSEHDLLDYAALAAKDCGSS